MQSKKVGGRRFSGYGLKKFDPRPGSIEWYKANMQSRFNTTKINIRNGLGCSEADAEKYAANVLRRIEAPIQGLIDSGALDVKKDRAGNKRCPGCGFNLEHNQSKVMDWDKRA